MYTSNDDGVHVTQGEDFKGVSIEWPHNGNVTEIRRVIANMEASIGKKAYKT